MTRAVLIAIALAGCSDPTFTLRFRVTDGLADACKKGNDQVFQCQNVPMSCAAVVSIRVFNPNTPTSPFISVCQELMMAPTPTLCEIAQVNLPQPAMPIDAQTLEVEILVYPKNKLQVDPNSLLPICPAMVDIGVDGFPSPSLQQCMPDQPCEASPAIGGIAFYHPGDPVTVVDLGCADLTLLNDPVCTGGMTSVIASVIDFDTLVSVAPSLAPRLTVSVGDPGPAPTGGTDLLDPIKLDYSGSTTPTWTGMIDTEPAVSCIEVDEDVAQSTKSVRCTTNTTATTELDLVGARLAKTTLDDIITALGDTGFPDNGLVVGIVLDHLGNPAGGLTVATTNGTIKYLSADRHSVAGSVTSTNGIFVSDNAAFGATFSATSGTLEAQAIGGLMDGKVTIVVLQIPAPTGE